MQAAQPIEARRPRGLIARAGALLFAAGIFATIVLIAARRLRDTTTLTKRAQ